jgi:hypothetical protein
MIFTVMALLRWFRGWISLHTLGEAGVEGVMFSLRISLAPAQRSTLYAEDPGHLKSAAWENYCPESMMSCPKLAIACANQVQESGAGNRPVTTP